MKPSNFPGRKNARRQRALARMKRPTTLSLAQQVEHPFFITQARIVPDEVARATRTKKDRSARGGLRK